MRQDLRFAIRTLWKAPGFTAVAILALALGIGANTAIFTVINSVLLRPLPFKNPERIARISALQPGLHRFPAMTDRDFLDFRKQSTAFEHVAAYSGGPLSLTGIGEPSPVHGWAVTAGFWPTLGISPTLGRTFVPEEETAARGQVVVLSDRLWRSHFGGDRSTIGKSVNLDGTSYTIIGVMPAEFAYPAGADLWTPLIISIEPGSSWAYQVIGRLKDGVSIEQALAEVQTIAARFKTDSKQPLTASVVSLHESVVGKIRPSLLILLAAVGAILLIACGNVANLLLARGSGRRQEIAVRASLGASSGRLLRQLLTESSLLALCGGVAGLLVASWTVPLLVRLVPPEMIPRIAEVRINGEVLAFTMLLALVTSILFGLAPALQLSRAGVAEFLKKSEARLISGQRLRSVLVVAEIALSLVLLIGAGLMIKSFVLLRSVNPGFHPEQRMVLSVNLPFSEPRTTQQLTTYHEQVLARLSALPGVMSAGAIDWLPFEGPLIRGTFSAEGKPHDVTRFNVSKPGVSPDYFQTMGIALLGGRFFDQHDTADSSSVTILSRSVARRIWGDENPVGKRITLEDRPKPKDWLTVVGMVDDVKQQSLAEKSPIPAIYQPLPQVKRPFFLLHMAYVVHVDGDPARVAGLMRARFREIDPNQPIQLISSMGDLVSATTAEPLFYSRMLGSFSALALLLASLGIYGVMAYSVAQRTREIGIRVALGAQPSDVFRSVIAKSAVLVSIGVAIGLAGAFAATRVLRTLLFEVTPTDAATFAGVSALLGCVALAATYLPARRATTVDPMVALRYE